MALLCLGSLTGFVLLDQYRDSLKAILCNPFLNITLLLLLGGGLNMGAERRKIRGESFSWRRPFTRPVWFLVTVWVSLLAWPLSAAVAIAIEEKAIGGGTPPNLLVGVFALACAGLAWVNLNLVPLYFLRLSTSGKLPGRGRTLALCAPTVFLDVLVVVLVCIEKANPSSGHGVIPRVFLLILVGLWWLVTVFLSNTIFHLLLWLELWRDMWKPRLPDAPP